MKAANMFITYTDIKEVSIKSQNIIEIIYSLTYSSIEINMFFFSTFQMLSTNQDFFIYEIVECG